MNLASRIYQNLLKRTETWHIKANKVLHGKAENIQTGLDISRFGSQNTQTQRWVDTFTNTDLLCQSFLVDLWKVGNLFTIEMVSKMIIELKTLSYLFKKFIGVSSDALTA